MPRDLPFDKSLQHTPAWRSPHARPVMRQLVAGILVLAWLTGCATKPPPAPHPVEPGASRPYKALGKWYTPIADSTGFRQRGIASWYGKKFHGKKTSSGEIYDMYGLSAAHKTLPMGTWVRVRNLENNKTLDVRINDRGPFVRGRIIDLSYGAAKQLDIIGPGTAPVEISALERAAGGQTVSVGADNFSGNFSIQVGAFQDPGNADRLKQKLAATYADARVVPMTRGSDEFYRVRVGQWTNLEDAQTHEARLIHDGFNGAIIIAE